MIPALPQLPGIGTLAAPLPPQAQPMPQPQTAAPDTTDNTDTSNLPMPPSGGATIGQRLQSPMSSPTVQRIAQSAGNTIKNNPEAVNKPGGISRLLVGAALEGLGASLGDAAAVGTVPAGGGALTGIARTLGARNQRIQQQKQQQFENQQETDKNKVLISESNARMLHEQKLVHQMDEGEIQQSVDYGNQVVQKLKTANQPAPVIAEGLTSDELKDYLKTNKIDPTKETAFPTGRRQMGENPDGTPIFRTTYTALGVPANINLDPSKPEDKKILDDMNKYAPPSQGKWGTTGVQNLTGPQFNWVMQQVADSKAATMARDKTLVDQQLTDKDTVAKKEAVTFGGPDWVNALANAPNHDPIAARNAILNNPTLAAKYPNIDSDLRYTYGAKEFDTMLDDYQKKVDMGLGQITDLQKELDKAHGEDAAGMAETFQAKINDPTVPAALKQRYQRMKDQANKQAQTSITYQADLKQREEDAEEKASTGDLSTLKDMALNYEVDPNMLFSRFKGMKEKQAFEADMHRQDPTWSEANYKTRYNTVNDFRPEGKGGQAVQSLNTFAGHVGDANSLISSLQNTRSPLLNTPLNKFKEGVLGQPQFVAYKTAVQAAADEYTNFLLSQKAKHASDDELVAKITSDKVSPAMAQSMMRQMANTVAIRARALNKNYRDTMQKDIPNYLDPDTTQVLRAFGIDPKSIVSQGPSGLINNVPKNAVNPTPGKAANGTPVWKMSDGTIQDASGRRYNPQTGQAQ